MLNMRKDSGSVTQLGLFNDKITLDDIPYDLFQFAKLFKQHGWVYIHMKELSVIKNFVGNLHNYDVCEKIWDIIVNEISYSWAELNFSMLLFYFDSGFWIRRCDIPSIIPAYVFSKLVESGDIEQTEIQYGTLRLYLRSQ